jgi:uncharacterized protein YdaU (DUF1376 family)
MEFGTKVRDNHVVSDETSGAGAETPNTALTTDADRSRDDMADADSIPGKSPAFQFYPNDFLADANVIVMTLQERGAYITLVCLCWQQGGLPSEVEKLARLCGSPVSTFQRLWPAIAPCFRTVANGQRLLHPRLERERQKQRAYRKQQSDKGKLGGRPKKPELSTDKAMALQNESRARPDDKAEKSSSSSSSSSNFVLHSSERKSAAAPDARSKHPVYTSDRFAVFEWQFEELSKMLGAHFEGFDVHSFFDGLTQQSRAAGLVIPKADAWAWLQAEVLAEAKRRGLPMASAVPVRDKAAENRAQDERILAEIQEERRLRAGR